MKKPAKRDFSAYICRPYCVFFKEGQKEDMSCGGAHAVMELLRLDLISKEDIPEPPGDDDIACDDPLLFETVCRTCPFVLDGCDFRMAEPPDDAVPCGGFILLRLLHDKGIIGPDTLRTAFHE